MGNSIQQYIFIQINLEGEKKRVPVNRVSHITSANHPVQRSRRVQEAVLATRKAANPNQTALTLIKS